MGINPEWPKSVVQVEGDQLGKREAICECFRSHRRFLEWLSILAFGSQHDCQVVYIAFEVYEKTSGLGIVRP